MQSEWRSAAHGRTWLRCTFVVACMLSSGMAAVAQKPVAHADYVVARPVINMFARPGSDSPVTSQALYGTGVQSIEKKGAWIKIRTADDYTGWVGAAEVHLQPGSQYASGAAAVQVAGLNANIYREPSVTEHAPEMLLPFESRLEVIADAANHDDRWLKVRLVDGETAWVQRGDVEAPPAPFTIDESLQFARRFLGITYTWGGVSTFGFDCSGFTQMIMRQRGIEMPRDARIQAAWNGVTPVERKDLKAGDLLFFGSSADHITHTGMYLGNGEFIHDTVHGHPGVQISRLDDAHWTQLFVAARRVKQ